MNETFALPIPASKCLTIDRTWYNIHAAENETFARLLPGKHRVCVRAGYNARMTANLTIEQHAELEQHGNQPMPILDPVNQKTYFLVPGELFERLRALLTNEPFDIRETYAAQEAAFSEIWDDPALDVYNDFDDSKLLP